MATTLTEVPKFENNDTVIPASGEPRTVASILAAFQRLADRTKYARGATWGNMIGGDVFSVDTGGTSTVFTARVNAFEAMVARDTNNVFWPRFTTADTTFTVADIEGTPGALANSSWYYAYLGVNTDGSLRKQLSTTGPGASRIWKSTAADQLRYVGCFPTTSSGAPLPLRRERGRVRYDHDSIQPSGITRVVNTTSTGVWATVNCAAVVPPHARHAFLYLETGAGSTAGSASIRRLGATTQSRTFLAGIQSTIGFGGNYDADMLLDASQRFEFFTDALVATTLAAWVTGFQE